MKKLSYYPAFLNLNGKKCVVFGGGQVALHKVKMFLDFGAEVEVVSPELCPELVQLVSRRTIKAVTRGYQPGDLRDVFIAIAATDDRNTNVEIAREGRGKGVLVNVVDVPELCDFIVPAYLRRGDLTIAISTTGKSPALARKIRSRLEREFDEEYSALAQLIGDVRAKIKRQGIKVDSNTWQKALDLDLLISLLKQGKVQEARAILVNSLKGNVEVSR